MKNKFYLSVIVAGGISLFGQVPIAFSADAASKTVDNAFLLCKMLDSTNLLSEPCSVSGWGSTVDISVDMNASEARKMCAPVKDMLASNKIVFSPGWSLKISSPYSGDKAIATCPL